MRNIRTALRNGLAVFCCVYGQRYCMACMIVCVAWSWVMTGIGRAGALMQPRMVAPTLADNPADLVGSVSGFIIPNCAGTDPRAGDARARPALGQLRRGPQDKVDHRGSPRFSTRCPARSRQTRCRALMLSRIISYFNDLTSF
jgi:hypothetical protein